MNIPALQTKIEYYPFLQMSHCTRKCETISSKVPLANLDEFLIFNLTTDEQVSILSYAPNPYLGQGLLYKQTNTQETNETRHTEVLDREGGVHT